MRDLTWIAIFCFVLFIPSCGNKSNTVDSGKNVVLLTLDGVRWQEVFQGTDPNLDGARPPTRLLRKLSERSAQSGLFLGDRSHGSQVEVSNEALLSLPAYQSILSGSTQDCYSNGCGRVPVDTLQETIRKELNLGPYDVATIASWKQISLAAEHDPGRTFVNVGVSPLGDGSQDETTSILNAQQQSDLPPWGDARADKYTFQHAIKYLKKHKPRFLFLSLNDADEWAHKGDYPQYIKTLRQYDDWIQDLFQVFEDLGEYGKNTVLLVTTDHGRGDHQNWAHHGSSLPEAKYVWLYAGGLNIKKKIVSQQNYSHNSIRPTIQAILGIDPVMCSRCGTVISELVDAVGRGEEKGAPSPSPSPSPSSGP